MTVAVKSAAAKRGWETRRENAARRARDKVVRVFPLADNDEFLVRQHHLDEAEIYWARLSPEMRRKHLTDGFFAHLPADMLERFRTEAWEVE